MNISNPRALLLSLSLAALIGSAAIAQQVTVSHVQGETTVDVAPEKVFSYDFASIDTLHSLGVDVDGAPPLAGDAPEWLPADLINIGTLFEPDYEVVNAEQPDLVIVAARSAAAYPELSGMAPTIDLTFGGTFIDDLARNTRTLGTIFGKEAEAEAALAEIQAKVDALRQRVAERGDGLVLMVSGGSLSVLAPVGATGGRGQLLYQTLGLTPALPDVQAATHGEPVSFEFLLEHDPAWLFVIDRDAAIGTEGAQPAAQVLDNEIMHRTAAWQQEQIVYLDPFNWYIITGAGLNSANQMLDQISAAYAD
jgi:iron complex transport system substrate-binding protein